MNLKLSMFNKLERLTMIIAIIYDTLFYNQHKRLFKKVYVMETD